MVPDLRPSRLRHRVWLRETNMNAAAEGLETETAHRWAVLLVEDEIVVRSFVAECLRDEGYRVIEAANAMEARAIFISGAAIDVVFTDWQLPGDMNGVELARWIDVEHPGIPLLLTSGLGYAAGWAPLIPRTSFISKPYSPDDVAARIRALISDRGQR
jgi:DNA-binding response OmpR family regulator